MPIGSLFSYQGFSGLYIPQSSTGFRLDGSYGYQFKLTDHLTLGPELEISIMYNQLNFLGDNFSLLQVPLLANAVLGWHFNSHWVAYVGVGGGFDLLLPNDSTGLTQSSEADGAFQVKGGIKYKFGSSALGLGVKYLTVKPSDEPSLGNTGIFFSYSLGF
jgi:opacity protein-like surface antigen